MNCDLTNVSRKSRLLLFLLGSILFLPSIQGLASRTSRTTLSVAYASQEWERYTLQDAKFSVLLPTVPAMSTHHYTYWDRSSKNRLKHLIAAYSQGVVYQIAIYEVKQSLDEFIAGAREPESGFKRELTLSRVHGKEYASEDETSKRVTQYFIQGPLIYKIGAYGSRLGNPDVDIPKFFGSITFDRPPASVLIADGPGVQPLTEPAPGTDGSGASVLTGKQVSVKARVISKPEPRYTEDARQQQITGTVVLRAVFSSSGSVINIRAMSALPYGLTEAAVGAARKIRFVPAIKDGKFVSMYIQLEYNFNLY